MSTSDSDKQAELLNEHLRGIATSLKGIHASLESLTAAVEEVSESIEKAHEPEGDLGVHLVGALKDLVAALHRKAGQERSHQHQQRENRHQQPRRHDERRPASQPPHDEDNPGKEISDSEASDSRHDNPEGANDASTSRQQNEPPRKNGGSGRGRGRRGGKPAKQASKE